MRQPGKGGEWQAEERKQTARAPRLRLRLRLRGAAPAGMRRRRRRGGRRRRDRGGCGGGIGICWCSGWHLGGRDLAGGGGGGVRDLEGKATHTEVASRRSRARGEASERRESGNE